MKFKIERKKMLSALQKTIKAVNSRAPLPILGYVLIKTENNGAISFSTTDLEFGIKCTVKAQVIEHGSICVPAKIITDLVSQLQEDRITIKQDNLYPLELTTDKSQYHIYTRETDEFPILPVSGENPLFTIPQSTFKEIVKSSVIAVSNMDEQRTALTGVLLKVDENGVTAVSTDGRRLVKVFEPLDEPPKKNFSVIVPQRSMKEINNLLEENEEPVNVIFSEGQVFLEFGQVNVFSRIIDGKFPNFEVVIPKQSDIKVSVDRKKLQESIKRSLIMAYDKDAPDLLKTEITNESIKLMSNSIEVGDAYEEVVVQEIEGQPVNLVLNGRYILDILNIIDDNIILIKLNGEQSPVLIKSPQKDNYNYIVMPVRLKKLQEEE